MPKLMRMPEVAANTTEAVLAEWAVAERAEFTAQQVIATVETEKAVVDVEAEDGGVLLRTLVPAGSQVEVGAPIALLADPGERVDDVDAALAELGVVADAPAVAPERRLVPDDPEGGTAATSGPHDGVPEPVPPAAGAAADGGPTANGAATTDGGRIFSSPLARRLAREAALPLEAISGTGPRGRILRRDVEAAIAAGPAAGAAATAAHPAPTAADATYTDVPHSRMRRAIANRLTESKRTAPHFYLRATLRVDALVRMRAQLNDGTGPKVSLNDLVVKAVARAHTLVPEMNATWTPDAVRRFESVDVAVAVATERGLVTPVLRGVERMSVTTVAERVRDLAGRARDGRLRQDELEGGTISVTNLGMFDVEEFAAVINPPHAAILAVGAVRDEPVVEDGALTVGKVMRVTLSVDHRPVDGVVAARWLQALTSVVETPVRILA
jgi:pyruvate dehydrogenase E2 component (dihydrolipoamide acetyltransferase)